MPKINQEEYEVLKGLDDKWKWIARDTSRNRHRSKLSKYKEKPEKTPYQWLAFNYEDMDDSKFKFIKWSDEEPYSIADLIGEYEQYQGTAESYSNNLARLSKHWFSAIDESEETEVKNIEWLRKEFDSLFNGKSILTVGKSVVDEILDQLDEPEVLSDKWIDEHKVARINNLRKMTMDDVVPVGKLQNLLVPKQELPVIPRFVADWITAMYNGGLDLYPALKRLESNALIWEDVFKWYRENTCSFVNAYLTREYKVGEEQKYYVRDKHCVYLLAKNQQADGRVETVAEIVEFYGVEEVELDYELTEQEIKDYDERYWVFRKPVEEME